MRNIRVLFVAFLIGILASGCGESGSSGGVDYPEKNFALSVAITNVRSSDGTIVGVLCRSDENFPNDCVIRQSQPAEGVPIFEFSNVPAGEYAFACFHDENEDGKINLTSNRLPAEGVGFSRNRMGGAGPPSFEQSALKLTDDRRVSVKIVYLGG